MRRNNDERMAMTASLTSRQHEVDDLDGALELAFESGWSDGLPVVPPTDARIARVLDMNGYEGDTVLATFPERRRSVTAEKAAINTVMAGCRPEYFPVVVAVLEAMTDPLFKFNHLASLGSPWPLMVVNGPIARDLGMASGMYLFGPGSRPNLTIGRAVSLTLRNCAGARAEEVQRGQWGNGMRFTGCIAENEDTPWEPLHVQRGFDREDSTVTLLSAYPGSPAHITINLAGLDGEEPARMLDAVAHAMAGWGGAQWTRGRYGLLVPPHMVAIFHREGWTKDDVRDYLIENTTSSIADLKRRGAWARLMTTVTPEDLVIEPGDETTHLHLLKRNPDHDQYLALTSALESRELGLLIVAAGGDAGARMQMTVPYQVSNNAVTRKIRYAG